GVERDQPSLRVDVAAEHDQLAVATARDQIEELGHAGGLEHGLVDHDPVGGDLGKPPARVEANPARAGQQALSVVHDARSNGARVGVNRARLTVFWDEPGPAPALRGRAWATLEIGLAG